MNLLEKIDYINILLPLIYINNIMNPFRSVINLPTKTTTLTIKKQFAYIGLQLINKYQQQLSDYLKYEKTITQSGDINVTVTPKQSQSQTGDDKKQEPYKFYVICK